MSAHRRPSLISRSARHKRARPHETTEDSSSTSLHSPGNTDGDERETSLADVDGAELVLPADDVLEEPASYTESNTDIESADSLSGHTAALDDISNVPDSPADSAGSPIDETDLYEAVTPEPSTILATTDASGDDDDYADYLRSVEEAAARSRAQQRRKRAAVAATAAPVAAAPISDGAGAVAQSTMSMENAAALSDPAAVPPRVRRGTQTNGRRPGGPRGPHGPRGRALPYREPDPRPRWKHPKTWFIAFAALVGLATTVVGGYAAYVGWVAIDAYDDINQPLATQPPVYTIVEGTAVPVPAEQAEQQLPNWDNNDPFNILLLGIDERPGDDEPPRSDTMIVVRVYPATKEVTMMSIPRDLFVTIPRYGDDKINAAFPMAELDDPGSGPALVMETINYNFGIRLHYYMTIDFEGFREVVNTLGGVIVDVRAPVKDDLYPTEDFGVTREYFPTGLQKMDGETALRFARTRHGDNDIARGDRQQQVLTAIREQASVSDLITQAPDLIRDFKDTVRTDLDANQLLALANLGRGVNTEDIVKVNLWDAGVLSEHSPEFEGDAFYMEADWESVVGLVDTYFASSTAGPPLPTATPDEGNSADGGSASDGESASGLDLSIPVIIQNASAYQGVAGSALIALENAGFTSVSREGTDEYSEYTLIYDYAESPETAQYIAAQFGLDESSIIYGSGGTGIIVVVGDDVGAGLGQ